MPDKDKKQDGLRSAPGEYTPDGEGLPAEKTDGSQKSFHSAQDRAADSSQGEPRTENEERARGNVPATDQS